MTREEAIESLRGILTEAVEFENSVCYVTEEDREPLEMAIKALAQESCEDAISRQAVLDCLTATKLKKFDFVLHAREEIKNLPPVNPQLKTGHWIGIDEEPHEDYECDRCGYVCSTFTANIKPSEEYKYCPNCGIKMIEPQESEDKK